MGLKPLYDFSFRLPDGSTVRLCGIGTLYQIRQLLKSMKQDQIHRKKAQNLTRRRFEITPHAWCTDCTPCKTCQRQKHLCECADGD